MLINNIKIAFRNLSKYKFNSILNILGLTLGLACFTIIIQYIQFELSFDKYHTNSKNIYRIIDESKVGSDVTKYIQTQAPLAKAMKEFFPEIKNTVRISKVDEAIIGTEDKRFIEKQVIFADPSILDVFSFELLSGNKTITLNNPYSMLITQSMAVKYFGNSNPIGKTLIYNNKHNFIITGVLKDIPTNSHFKFGFLGSLACADQVFSQGFLTNKRNTSVYTYIQLHINASAENIKRNMYTFILQLYGDVAFSHWKQYYYLQPLESIHLYSHLSGEIEPNSDILYIYLLSTVAFIIIFIASINYMNLSTAIYTNRAKEVGMRKVIGASKYNLLFHFLTESLLITFISSLIAISFIEIIRPAYNSFFNNTMSVRLYNNPKLLLILIASIFFTGIASGSYPAFFLSSFNPLSIIRKDFVTSKSNLNIRNILMMLQFSLSLILIAVSIVIYKQVDYVHNKNTGINKEQLIVVPLNDKSLRTEIDLIKYELFQNPKIKNATASSALPGGINTVHSVQWEGAFDNFNNTMSYIHVDHDFLNTFGIELAEGRNFEKENTSDASEAYLLNETAVKSIGWESPIGKKFKTIYRFLNEGKIIGVMKDFHFKSMHHKIEPIVFYINPKSFNYLTIKVDQAAIPATINYINRVFDTYSTKCPFEYCFFDDFYDRFYKHERKLLKIVSLFAIITIFISCLGLLGISSYTAERRIKEIGIRKVLGASVIDIFFLLTRDYNKYILIANFFAWPVAWYVTQFWLHNFAYRINVNIFYFLISSSLLIILSFLTTSNIIFKYIKSNPIKALRFE